MFFKVNKVILVGRMGADPEVVNLDDDRKVIHYTVATSETRSDKEGKYGGYRYGHAAVQFHFSSAHMAPITRKFGQTNTVAPYYFLESGSQQLSPRKDQERVSR